MDYSKLTNDELDYSKLTNAELDKLIAEKRGESTEHLPEQYMEWVTEDGEDGGSGFYCPRCKRSATTPFCLHKYSTDPRYAMELLLELPTAKRMMAVSAPPEKILRAICTEWMADNE